METTLCANIEDADIEDAVFGLLFLIDKQIKARWVAGKVSSSKMRDYLIEKMEAVASTLTWFFTDLTIYDAYIPNADENVTSIEVGFCKEDEEVLSIRMDFTE